ncbi:hypothetical protein O0L34_g14973 [Tuta absoluta]|nr:hypothetical protein O0L34_g14973 [Tuta absoluta]
MTHGLQQTLDKYYKELVKTIDGDPNSAQHFDPADNDVNKLLKFMKKSSERTLCFAIFKQTHNLLCEQKDPLLIEKIWELLSHMIDNLSSEEDEELYETLVYVRDVPMPVRGKYLTKCYNFALSLPLDKRNKPCGYCNEYEEHCNDLIAELKSQMEEVLDQLDPEFVANALLDSYEKKVTTTNYNHFGLMASNILCARDVESQTERYEKVVRPILEHCLVSWDVLVFYVTDWQDDGYWAKKNAINMLKTMYNSYLNFVVKQKNIVPTKIFADMQAQLEKGLPVEENYKTLTTWKLITSYMTVLEEQIKEARNVENDICLKAVPKFSQLCLQYLRQDIDKYNLSVYRIFSECLNNVFKHKDDMKMVYFELLQYLLKDEEFVPSYLVVLNNIPQEYERGDELGHKVSLIREKIFTNPSVEVKMHYYKKYGDHNVDPIAQ